jgi:5'(3')-deoxyribonucleotidase
MEIKTILCDLDGVIVDFVGGSCALHGRSPDEINWDADAWSYWNRLNISSEDFWGAIDRKGPAFWAGLECYPWAAELVIECNRAVGSENVYACTSPSSDPSSAAGKVQWMKYRTVSFKPRNYIITPHKHLLANEHTLLIDDSDANVQAFMAAGGLAVLVPQPWNTNAMHIEDRLGYIKASIHAFADL